MFGWGLIRIVACRDGSLDCFGRSPNVEQEEDVAITLGAPNSFRGMVALIIETDEVSKCALTSVGSLSLVCAYPAEKKMARA